MEREKKECILLAAAKAFSRHGFKKASVDEIAKAAGVAKGTVYLACDSKEDLFYQSLHREVRHWLGEVSKVIDPRMPAEQLLVVAAQVGVDYLRVNRLLRDLLVGAVELPRDKWADKLDELRALGRANIIEILNIGIKQKRFRDDLDVAEVAAILQDLMLSFHLEHANRAGDAAWIQKRMQTGYQLVMTGLATEGARAS